jgi:hypothetical protein
MLRLKCKHVQPVKIYLPCNCEVNPITHFAVIVLFSSNFQNFNTSKTFNFTICSIYRHGGHDGWSAGSSDITFKGNPLRMIQAKFGLKLAQWFQRRRFLKKFTDGWRTQQFNYHIVSLMLDTTTPETGTWLNNLIITL